MLFRIIKIDWPYWDVNVASQSYPKHSHDLEQQEQQMIATTANTEPSKPSPIIMIIGFLLKIELIAIPY
jgi:hypothetical protein